MAAAKKGAKRKRSADDAKPRHSDGKPKPASWLKARPNGCGKCRCRPRGYVDGLNRSISKQHAYSGGGDNRLFVTGGGDNRLCFYWRR